MILIILNDFKETSNIKELLLNLNSKFNILPLSSDSFSSLQSMTLFKCNDSILLNFCRALTLNGSEKLLDCFVECLMYFPRSDCYSYLTGNYYGTLEGLMKYIKTKLSLKSPIELSKMKFLTELSTEISLNKNMFHLYPLKHKIDRLL